MEIILLRGLGDNDQQSQYCQKYWLNSTTPYRVHHTMCFGGVMVSLLCCAGVHWSTHAYSACLPRQSIENQPHH